MAELVDRWPAAVGSAIARNAWPARIARDGTVHVNTADSVWAFELGQRAAEITARLRVPAVRFAPGPLPAGAAGGRPPSAEPTPEEEALGREIAAEIADENLRGSVQKAFSLGLARERVGRSV
jgi:hypothetical protein